MPTVASMDIILDRPDARYKPGETVTGEVYLKLNKEKQCKGLTFRAKGHAFVSWTETTKHGRYESTTKYYSDKRTYIDEMSTVPLSGKAGAVGILLLQPGVYQHRFAIDIPLGAPATFSKKGKTGYISYELKANLLKTWFWGSDYKVAKTLTVTPFLDLKRSPFLSKPTFGQFEEKVGWCCWKSGFAFVSFALERTGYVPGERIAVSASVETLTRGSLKFKARLIQDISYRAVGKTRNESKVVAKQPPSAELVEGDTWSGEDLKVRELHPTMGSCEIIKIDYVLKLKVNFSAGGSKSIKIPIIIGTESCVADDRHSNSKTNLTKLMKLTKFAGPNIHSNDGFVLY